MLANNRAMRRRGKCHRPYSSNHDASTWLKKNVKTPSAHSFCEHPPMAEQEIGNRTAVEVFELEEIQRCIIIIIIHTTFYLFHNEQTSEYTYHYATDCAQNMMLTMTSVTILITMTRKRKEKKLKSLMYNSSNTKKASRSLLV